MSDVLDSLLYDDAESEVAEQPEVEASVEDGGQVEAEGTPTPTDDEGSEATAEELSYLDLESYGSQLVKVKVDGEEFDVPLEELRNGYQRQADYTRGKQQVAYWLSFQEAAQENPQLALSILAHQLGIDPTSLASQGGQAAVEDDDEDWGYEDPYDAKLDELRSEIAPIIEQVRLEQAEKHLSSVVAGLEQKYQHLGFNRDELLQAAMQRGVYDPDQLESVFRDIKFEEAMARAAAVGDHQQAQQLQQQQRQEAAARQAELISAEGSAGGPGSEPAPAPSKPLTIAEAAALALAEQGYQL